MLKCLSLCLPLLLVGVLGACGSDETPPPSGDAGAGGSAGDAAGSAGTASLPSGGSGAGGGENTAGTTESEPQDAGAIRYPDPPLLPEPPEVGDSLQDEGAVGGRDAGVAPDGGVGVGEVDPAYGYASACLHVDLQVGSYQVVPDAETPDERLERVLLFANGDDGFSLLAFYPWQFTFVDPESPPSPLPTGVPLVVDVSRNDVALRVSFVLSDSSVSIQDIVVQAI